MTVPEVASYLQVAEIFVYRHAKEIGAFKVGSHLRFQRSRVEAWLDEQLLDPDGAERQGDVEDGLVGRLLDRARERTST